MAVFFHGSSVYFEKFDLAHAMEGDGKCKFGYGAYFTEDFASAAHYAYNKKRPENREYYVYTVDIPDLTLDNSLPLHKQVPVPAGILGRAERKLGVTFPEEATTEGIPFRKYLANWLTGVRKSAKQMTAKATPEGEKAAAEFLLSIGVELIVWPFLWKDPHGKRNMAVLDSGKIRILRIDQVDLDPKEHHLVGHSERLVKEFK